jgi:hypothetical protein
VEVVGGGLKEEEAALLCHRMKLAILPLKGSTLCLPEALSLPLPLLQPRRWVEEVVGDRVVCMLKEVEEEALLRRRRHRALPLA